MLNDNDVHRNASHFYAELILLSDFYLAGTIKDKNFVTAIR